MHLYPADILMPDFTATSGKLWSVVACDQYTAEPEYWRRVEDEVGSLPSTLRLMLPEVYLGEADARVPAIHAAMRDYIDRGILKIHRRRAVWLERTQSDGRVRSGLVAAVDLEEYDFSADSASLIRPTERTVAERIPPRIGVRRGAALEMPHVMLLIDDPADSVLWRFSGRSADAYDFDLMEGGGHVRGGFVGATEMQDVNAALDELLAGKTGSDAPILFAVGDGNHSLATAKTVWEEYKAAGAPVDHPARYALCEVVNLHDPALEFEPIYRLAFGCDTGALIAGFRDHAERLCGCEAAQTFRIVTAEGEETVTVRHPEKTLSVATLQDYLDSYAAAHPLELDYIHGEATVVSLAAAPGKVGFLFDGMRKNELFRAVERSGALPRKTFSMGHAADKRFYLECRRIDG